MGSQLVPEARVFVAGAGTMGAGIAEVAALAGHHVRIFDPSSAAIEQSQKKLAANLAKRVSRGTLSSEAASLALGRVQAGRDLSAAGGAGLVVEAISEDLGVKRSLFRDLEGIVEEGCVLASNTSSLSITELAAGMQRPERVVGMHFFNPVPLMQLVEVVSGLHTAPAVAEQVFELARSWGKVPISVRSTPGFVVNRIARPFYAEALALLRERAAEPDIIDACVRGAGFRMGPCELMDLIGHDVNLAVTESIFRATFGDERFVPSLVQRELVTGGWLGRKSGRGFFQYRDGIRVTPPSVASEPVRPRVPDGLRLTLHGRGPFVERCASALRESKRPFEYNPESGWTGLVADGRQLRMTDGRPAGQVGACEGAADVAVFDLPTLERELERTAALAWAPARSASPEWQRLAPEWIAAAGWVPHRVADSAGLIVARTIAMLINEAADAVLQGVAEAGAVDAAMRLAVNYPRGPLEWLERWHVCEVAELLDHVDEQMRGARYRVSQELRQRAWSCQMGRHASWLTQAPGAGSLP